MRKLFGFATLVGAAVLVWRLWQQNQADARVWASATDRVR
jgi:hypothetical protein